MLISVLCAISSLLSLLVVLRLLRLRKHDKVLYRFCHARRLIMGILRTRGFELKKEDYLVLRELQTAVCGTIHHYDHCKITIFNLRKLQAYTKQLRQEDEEIAKFENIKDEEVRAAISAFRQAMYGAFFAYTPLFKSRILLSLLGHLFKVLSSLGVRGLNDTAANLFWLDERVSRVPCRQTVKA